MAMDAGERFARAVCRAEGLDAGQVRPLSGGQVNQVFLIDQAYVLRIGGRADAHTRLRLETELLQRLEGRARVARVLAAGQLDGQAYQIQTYIPGGLLYRSWPGLSAAAQDDIAASLAESLREVHSLGAPGFGDPREEGLSFADWETYLAAKFERTLRELETLHICMPPGMAALAADYFERHRGALSGGAPTVVHSDLTLVNLLEHEGRLAALIDFEYAMHAPLDYELWALEAFCLYPNDWAEEGNEIYTTADFSTVIPLLRRHYPGLFAAERLRERLNLYQLDGALSSYLAWRKAQLERIPPERPAGQDFIVGRVGNFIWDHGARLI